MIVTVHRNRLAWLADRRSVPSVGGSDLPAILGLSPWKSTYALWAAKVAPEAEGFTPQDEPESAYWGHVLEPVVRAELAKRAEVVIEPRPFTIWRRADNPAHAYSPDGEIVSPWRGPAEIKTRSGWKSSEWDGEEPPLDVVVQVQWGLWVCEAERALVGALIGGQKFKWAEVRRHEGLIAGLVEKADEFLAMVRERRPPEPDDSESTEWAIKRLFPRETIADLVPLSDDLAADYADLVTAKQDKAEAEREVRGFENKLKAAIGGHAGGRLPDGSVVAWKTQKRDGYVVEPCEYRVLRHAKGERA